jgi:DNA-binding transcriptional regulator PaaX
MPFGNTQKKIILLLYAGLGLAFSPSPRRSWKIIKATRKEWQWVNRTRIKRSVHSLQKFGILKSQKNRTGEKIVLTAKGKKLVKQYELEKLKIKKPPRWDKKWRIVIFDIPEEKRPLRDVFRRRLKKLGFHELQHSVWAHPYDCVSEIKCLVDFYTVPQYVHLLETSSFSNDKFLKKKFSL